MAPRRIVRAREQGVKVHQLSNSNLKACFLARFYCQGGRDSVNLGRFEKKWAPQTPNYYAFTPSSIKRFPKLSRNQSSTAASSDLQAIEALAADLGYEVIDIEHSSDGLLRVYIDMPDADRLISVQDCERVSNHLVHGLPVMGIDFQRLEVSSPGMDRRLTKPKHFRQFLGCEVKLKLRQPLSGRKNFQGQLSSAEPSDQQAIGADQASHQDEQFFLIFQADDGSEQQLDFLVSDIDQARLVPQLPFKERRP